MFFYNPFKPHIVEMSDGSYRIRKFVIKWSGVGEFAWKYARLVLGQEIIFDDLSASSLKFFDIDAAREELNLLTKAETPIKVVRRVK